jgi:CubicO group peptidase (beta-lactamase class C family)
MEYGASWSLDSHDSGFEKMSMGLNARAIDFAKFGQLFLDNGRWQGKEVIPGKWVVESTSPDANDVRYWRRVAPWIDTVRRLLQVFLVGLRHPDGSYAFTFSKRSATN